MRRSSASAAISRACSPSTTSSTSRSSRWSLAGARRRGARLRHQLPGAARLRPDAADGDARRRADAARDRQPLFRPHRRRRRPAGHHHGSRSSACSGSICSATPATSTASSCCSSVPDRAAHRHSPFGLSLRSVKGNPLRAAAIGIPVNRRLVAIYTIAAVFAGIAGALLTQTTAFCSLDVFSFERSADLLLVLIIGGTGYLYGGLIGAVIFKFMQDWIATPHAAILAVLDRPRARRDRADRPRPHRRNGWRRCARLVDRLSDAASRRVRRRLHSAAPEGR